MKRTFKPHLVLTLFMLVVVMIAAFFFLFRSWSQVAENADTLAAAAAAAETERDTAATRAATLDADLVNSQQDIDRLTTALETAQSTIAQFTAESGDEATRVIIASPLADSQLMVGTAVDVIALAIDPAGIETIQISIDEEISRLPTAGPTPVESITWTPEEEGPTTIEVMVTTTDGRSRTVTREVIVAPAPDPPQAAEPQADTAVVGADIVPFSDTLQAGEPVELAIFAVDTDGITQVTVLADDTEITSFPADEEPFLIEQTLWTPDAAREYPTTIVIQNVNGEETTVIGPTLVVEDGS